MILKMDLKPELGPRTERDKRVKEKSNKNQRTDDEPEDEREGETFQDGRCKTK